MNQQVKTIFKRPIYINPQAYDVIPELVIGKGHVIDSNVYSTKVLTNGIITMKTSNDKLVMQQLPDKIQFVIPKVETPIVFSLDLHLDYGCCSLGEWILNASDFDVDLLVDNLELENDYNILYEDNGLILLE